MNRLQKARAKMLLRHPFFATLMMSTPMVITKDVPTMATDMAKLYINPDFVEEITDDDISFVLAHEVMHIALEHGLRLQGRNPQLWNIAADYALNLILVDSGFERPSHKCGGLFDDQYKGMTADQIYEKLQQDVDKARKQGKSGAPGEPGSGIPGLPHEDLMAPDAKDAAEAAKLQRSVQQRVAQAANVARMQGKLSGSLERLVDQILNPVVPWADLLRDYMTRISKDDESWTRRNRRFRDVYLPSRWSQRMGEIVIIGDTSGSITQEELDQVGAEVSAIVAQVNPERVRVVWCDAKVAGEQVFEPGEPLTFEPQGGGGTDMRVALTHIEQYDPQVAVLITDGYTPWPDVEPDYPLITCSTTNANIPVGLVVRMRQ